MIAIAIVIGRIGGVRITVIVIIIDRLIVILLLLLTVTPTLGCMRPPCTWACF